MARIVSSEELDQRKTPIPLKEVMGMLGVSRRTLYRMIERGQLHAFKTSEKAWRVTRQAVEQFIKQGGSTVTTRNPFRVWPLSEALEKLLQDIHEQGEVATRVTIKSSDGHDYFLVVQDDLALENSSINSANSSKSRKP